MVLLNLLNDCGVNESSLFFGRVALVGGLGRKTCSLNYKLCVLEVKFDLAGGLDARLKITALGLAISAITGLCLNYYYPVTILFKLLFRFSRRPYDCCCC